MKVSANGIQQLKRFEGERLDVYNDGFGFPTVGVGHLVKPKDNLQIGDTISAEKSTAFFQADLASYEKIVNDFVRVALLECEFDMLVSLAFNIGIGNFKSSSLLRALNNGNHKLAADKFLQWVYVEGQKVKGLITRRTAERNIFINGY